MCVHGWSARLLDWLARGANEGRCIFARILLRLPQGSKAKRLSRSCRGALQRVPASEARGRKHRAPR